MKKILTVVFCAVVGVQICAAQFTTKKYTVAIGEFKGKYAENMRSASFGSMPVCRVNVVDLDNCNIDEVDYIVACNIGEPSTERGNSILLGDYISAKVPFTLVLTDARTGQVVATREHYTLGTDKDKMRAISNAQKFEDYEMRRLIDKGCIARVQILTVESKKDKATTAYAAGGATIGICKDLCFDVQVETDIAGRKIYKTIGAAKAVEVLGDDMVQIEITKGNKEVKKMFDEGLVLVVTSKEAPSKLFE